MEVDGLAGLAVLVAPGHQVGRGRDRVDVASDVTAGEQRLGNAPVAPPAFTIADQEPVGEEVPELANDRSVLDVMPGVSGEA